MFAAFIKMTNGFWRNFNGKQQGSGFLFKIDCVDCKSWRTSKRGSLCIQAGLGLALLSEDVVVNLLF